MSLTAKKRLKNPANHSRYGIHLSEETKRKISLHHKKYYENPENHPMYGKKHFDEAKHKIGLGHLGKPLSEEHKRKIGNSIRGDKNGFYGKKHSDKTKIQIGASKKGSKLSEDHKKAIGKAVKGENNGNWKGGKSFEVYPIEFNELLKEKIRTRDNHTCQVCNIKQEEVDRRLCVHHIDYDKMNNDPSNLITLCKTHHSKTNFNRDYWEKHFTIL